MNSFVEVFNSSVTFFQFKKKRFFVRRQDLLVTVENCFYSFLGVSSGKGSTNTYVKTYQLFDNLPRRQFHICESY